MLMREIKFRAWNKKVGDIGMYYPKVIQLNEKGEVDKLWTDTHKLTTPPDDIILMQYTGLKDKNDKLIFEGDIVKHMASTWVIKGVSGGYIADDGYENLLTGERGIPMLQFGEDWHKSKVIGNIYENPELLESEEL